MSEASDSELGLIAGQAPKCNKPKLTTWLSIIFVAIVTVVGLAYAAFHRTQTVETKEMIQLTGAELDAHADANDAVQSGKALVDIIKAGSAGDMGEVGKKTMDFFSESAGVCTALATAGTATAVGTGGTSLAPTLVCSAVAVGANFVSDQIKGVKGKPTSLDDVMNKIQETRGQIAQGFTGLEEKMDKDFNRLDEHMDRQDAKFYDDLFDEIDAKYHGYIVNSELETSSLSNDRLLILHSKLDKDDFEEYLRLVMKLHVSKKDPSWKIALAKGVPRIIKALTRLTALRMAQCIKSQCRTETQKGYAEDLKNRLDGYQQKVKEMCLLDLSKTRTLAELSAGCFENPHWHPESEWKEWKESESELTGDLFDLSNWTSLRHLEFRWNNKITGDLSSLSGLKSLQYLDFRWNKKQITGDLSSLSGLKLLQHLDFHDNHGITGDLSSLSGLESLQHLDFFSNYKITGDLRSLKGLKLLQHLDFHHNALIMGNLRFLAGVKSLQHLDFGLNNKITGDLSSLSGLKSLQHLDFYDSEKITGDLRSLASLQSLKHLWLAHANVSGSPDDLPPSLDEHVFLPKKKSCWWHWC